MSSRSPWTTSSGRFGSTETASAWRPPGITGTQYAGDELTPAGAMVMFNLRGDLLLALYPRTELAKDSNLPPRPAQPGEFSLGHLVESAEEVDAALARAQGAGGTVTEAPHERPWGIYSGYFQDPDGHLWEVIFNPRG